MGMATRDEVGKDEVRRKACQHERVDEVNEYETAHKALRNRSLPLEMTFDVYRKGHL